MIRMLIVDDEYYIRLGIVHAFDWSSMNIKIVGEAQDGAEGFELAMEKKPDLILMDICMPFLNGLELMQKLRGEKMDCGIIVLSGYDEFEYAQKSLQYGVLDYLLKPIDKQKLRETIEKACLTIRNKRSLQNYQNFAQQEHPAIRNQFLQDILLGNITDSTSIEEKIRFLHLPLIDGCYQLICARLDDYQLLENQLPLGELHQLKELINEHMASHFILGKSYMGMIVSLSPDEWGILLSFTSASSFEEQKKQLRKSVEEFFFDMETITAHTLSLSISPVTQNLKELAELYQNARRSNKKYIPRRNSVVWPSEESDKNIRPEIQGIINFVKNHYNEPITIQQAADSLYISPSYLMHLFKSNVGKTFNTFLLEYRMEKAKELLKKPGIQIQTVAAQVGYSDVKYFNKLFKKYTSLTPSDYIRIHYAKH